MNRQFSEEKIQMATKYTKETFNILSQKGKTNQNYTKKSVRLAIIKKTKPNKCWQRCGERNS
jgi:hypothetical protein